jgi:hypothetical protein
MTNAVRGKMKDMKRFICAALVTAAGLSMPTAAQALLGFLVRWETGSSVTGKLVYICYYNVAGTTQKVVLTQMCPPSMDFD